jgi:hypothetical protein
MDSLIFFLVFTLMMIIIVITGIIITIIVIIIHLLTYLFVYLLICICVHLFIYYHFWCMALPSHTRSAPKFPRKSNDELGGGVPSKISMPLAAPLDSISQIYPLQL